MIIWVGIGLFSGAILGFFTASILASGKFADMEMDEKIREMEYNKRIRELIGLPDEEKN
ncbi:MAG: hypothetical protein V1850_02630 [Candidatus Bathyarchaeota archaeon]